MKPEDALTDGPILDVKAKRGPEPSSGKGADTRASGAAPRTGTETPRGSGFGALAAAGLIGGLIGGGLLFLLMQSGMLAPKGETSRIDALDRRIMALASGEQVAALDKRVAANEQALKPLPEAVVRAQTEAKTATERADQALQKTTAPAAPNGEAGAQGAAPAQPVPSDLLARLDALDQRVSALQEEPGRDQPEGSKLKETQSGDESVRLADLDERLKALETRGQAQGAPAVPEEDLAPKLAALQGAVEARAKANEAAGKAFAQRLDALQQSLDSRVASATEAVQQATQASRQAAEAGKVRAEEAAKALDRRFQEQGERIAALDKAVDGAAKAATVQAALRAVAADRIAVALDGGAPYADALGSLRGGDAGDGAKLEPLAAFADAGAPTAASLAEEFRPIAEKIAASRRAAKTRAVADSGGIGDKLMSMAESIVQVKRVPQPAPTGTPTAGTAPQATASTGGEEPEARVQDALDRGRIGEAVQAFTALPEDARAQAKPFGDKLKAVADARAAAQTLQSDAFKGLSAPAAVR